MEFLLEMQYLVAEIHFRHMKFYIIIYLQTLTIIKIYCSPVAHHGVKVY
jgi:hypothetical protein